MKVVGTHVHLLTVVCSVSRFQSVLVAVVQLYDYFVIVVPILEPHTASR